MLFKPCWLHSALNYHWVSNANRRAGNDAAGIKQIKKKKGSKVLDKGKCCSIRDRWATVLDLAREVRGKHVGY